MSLTTRMLILAVLIGGIVAGTIFVSSGKAKVERTIQTDWVSSSQCMECHKEVWDEWHGAHHQIAYTNPEVRNLSNDFRNKECQTCHLPRPVFETGIAQRPLPRTSLPDEGVSCLTCHLGPDGGIVGRHDMPEAPCTPKRNEEFLSVDMCATCHNQHFTTDQFRGSSWPDKQMTCSSCHMEEVSRPNGRQGYDHRFLGAHDNDFLRRAAKVDAKWDQDQLTVSVANIGAGHSLPTEERHRAVDVEWRALLEDGSYLPADGWERMHRFRMMYVSEGGADYALHADDTWTGSVEVPASAKALEVTVWYRLQPFATNADLHRDPGQEDFQGDSRKLWSATLSAPGASWTSPPSKAFEPRKVDLEEGVGDDIATPAYQGPNVPEFEAMIAAADAPPDEARMKELEDLRDTAFRPGYANTRVANLAKRQLLESTDAFWILETGLLDEDVTVASLCAYHLGDVGNAASVHDLVKRLKYETDDPVNLVWVVQALHRLGNDSGFETLAGLMSREDVAQQAGQTAIQMLRSLGRELSDQPTYEELIAACMEINAEWRETGVGQLGREPDPDLANMDPLLKARLAARLIDLTGVKFRLIDDCRFIFARMGKTGLPMLQPGLEAKDPYIPLYTLEILGMLGPVGRPLADRVVPLMNAPVTSMATKAMQALGLMRAGEHSEAVRRWLDPAATTDMLPGKALDYRVAAAEALGPMGDTAAEPLLQAILDDPDALVDLKIYAAFSLAYLQEGAPTVAFMQNVLEQGSFHPPTVRELMDRLKSDGIIK